jgi:hypothetical protein
MVLAVAACSSGNGEDEDDGGAAESSESAAQSESSSAGDTANVDDDDGTSSSASGDASADVTAEGGDDEDEGEEQGESGAPTSPCSEDELELTNVVLEVAQNRILDEDVAVAFDDASWACAQVADDVGLLIVHYGPHAFGEPQSSLRFVLRDGVRAYDLAMDPAPPGSGDDGLLYFGHTYQYESASTYQFDTSNQAATGTLDILAHPLAGDTTVEFTAVGTIAGNEGWEFDLHFTADVVAQ